MKKLKKITLIFLSSILFITLGTSILYKLSWRVHRNIDTIKENIDTMKRIGIEDIAISILNKKEKIKFKSDGLTITGGIYSKNNNLVKPGILLLHGSSRWGRKLPLYPLMATKLAECGYTVLLIDLRGFGESDDPKTLDNIEAINECNDAKNAINFLASRPNVDENKLFIIGHSLGAGIAMKLCSMDDRIKKIVAIGPPRRLLQRLKSELPYHQKRYSLVRNLKELVPENIFNKYNQYRSIENIKYYFSNGKHQPILLVDGELEGEADINYLKNFYTSLTPPKKYITLSNTAHYLNTSHPMGLGLTIYDAPLINNFIDEIDSWLRLSNSNTGKPQESL